MKKEVSVMDKKDWTEPKLMEIEKVSSTASCASGGVDAVECFSGGAAFTCNTGSSANF